MPEKVQKGSVRYRFLTYIGITLFVSTAFLSVLIALNEYRTLGNALVSKGKSLGSYIALISQDPLVMKDFLQLDSIVSEVNKDEDILFTYIANDRGTIVTSTFASIDYNAVEIKPLLAKLPKTVETPQVIDLIRRSGSVLLLSTPISSGDFTIGRVSIGLSQRNIHRQIVHTVLYIVGLNVLVALVLGVILFFVSKKLIFSPLTGLAEATTHLAGGNLETRIGIEATGEVKSLIDAFNQMAENLNRSTVSREYVDSIIGSMVDAVIAVTPECVINRVNQAACELLGYAEQELIGQSINTIFGWSDPAPEGLYCGEFPKQEQTASYEELYRTRDGRTLSIQVTVSGITDESSALRGHVYVVRDITDRKIAEDKLLAFSALMEQKNAELSQALVNAEAATTAKSQFLATMSHEIRTPMNGVIGMINLLLDTELNEEQRQFAEIVHKSGENLLGLINDILDFSKIEAGKLDIEVLDFDLRTMVEDTAEMLAMRATEAGLELICRIAPEVPTYLKGDPGRLRQIITNLAGNAIKFTHEGEIVIHVVLDRESAEGTVIRFEVTDTGIGIPKERQGAIFNPFTQADGSTTRKYGGTGLGLAICKQLTELMGGEVGLESEVGKGSTFWFTARLERAADRGEPAESHAPANLSGSKVLVIDDNATNRTLMVTLLKNWGCPHETAQDAETGLALLRDAAGRGEPFRVALLDQEMPGMDGLELGRRIKADPQLQATLLIMVTSLGRRGDASTFEKSGFVGYLAKPVRQAQLYSCIDLALKRGSACVTQAGIITRFTVAESAKRGVRILLAEDNVMNQKVAQSVLGKLGYKTDVVANGLEAVRALEMINYDLVLMDCMMPDMDGFEATALIRSPESKVLNHLVPIIAMTANAMKGDREHCLEAGMDDYLSKPVKKEELAELLGTWLRHKSSGKNVPKETPAPPEAVPPPEQMPPLVDTEGLWELFGGDQEMAKTILKAGLEEIAKGMKNLQLVCCGEDVAATRLQAHTLKGVAANLCSGALKEVAFRMEQAAKNGELQQARDLIPEMEKTAQSTMDAIRVVIEG